MQGQIWVNSDVNKGSQFMFTIVSQINSDKRSQTHTLADRMKPFQGRTILFVDSTHDKTNVTGRISELGLVSLVVHDVADVADKNTVPYIDTIIVDSLPVVRCLNISYVMLSFD
jgi:osomolarity two-component system, sensor histidine kinase NIK1